MDARTDVPQPLGVMLAPLETRAATWVTKPPSRPTAGLSATNSHGGRDRCGEISWRSGSTGLSPIKEGTRFTSEILARPLFANGICFALSSCMNQPYENARCSPPPSVRGSCTSIQNTTVRVDTGADDDGLSAFLGARRRLFGIAYRMLQSAPEAEDIVQDVWIRWQSTDRAAIRDPAAFLATTTTRLAINVIQSARSRRETPIESSFPEPVETGADPELRAERSEALQSAVLVLLKRLSPAERAAYILREAFDYPYREIANILCLEEANSRQLVTRARRHVAEGRHATVNSAEQRCFLAAFVAAAREGALQALESLFSSGPTTARLERRTGSTGWTDGRGATAVPHPRPRGTLLPQCDVKVA